MHELTEMDDWAPSQGPRLPPGERLRRFAQHARAEGVEAKARELCIAAGEDPNLVGLDAPPRWQSYVYEAREALGFVAEVKYSNSMWG